MPDRKPFPSQADRIAGRLQFDEVLVTIKEISERGVDFRKITFYSQIQIHALLWQKVIIGNHKLGARSSAEEIFFHHVRYPESTGNVSGQVQMIGQLINQPDSPV